MEHKGVGKRKLQHAVFRPREIVDSGQSDRVLRDRCRHCGQEYRSLRHPYRNLRSRDRTLRESNRVTMSQFPTSSLFVLFPFLQLDASRSLLAIR